MYIGLHIKHLLFLTDFNQTKIFSTDFRKYINSKFRESAQWEPSFMRACKHDKANSFHNFVHVSKKNNRVLSHRDIHRICLYIDQIQRKLKYTIMY